MSSLSSWDRALASAILLLCPLLGVAQSPTSVPLAPASGIAGASTAQTSLMLSSVRPSQTLHVLVGQSLMLHSPNPIKRVYIGNPAVLQSFTSGPEEIVLTAKTAGMSSLVMWDQDGHSCLYSVSSDLDPSDLQRALDEAYPTARIRVDGTADRVALSGTVTTPEIAEGAGKLAANYTKYVANSLRVVPIRGKQVELKLRILEVDRTKMDQFGINLSYGGKIAATTGTASTASGSTSQFSNPLNLSFFNARTGIGVQLQDLEQRQVVQILAEPTLTTMSGLPARFLSGGEFPFPVAQGGAGSNNTAITIQFRTYGVKVDFTPTVNLDGSIRLKVAPEVSALDYSNAVTISGFTVPALSTRRAESEVELKDGESFLLSGLLDHRTSLLLAGAPGIENVPILGQLFRSKNNTRSVVELVFMVQVKIVDPLTVPGDVHEPKWSVPNLDTPKFDKTVPGSLENLQAERNSAASQH